MLIFSIILLELKVYDLLTVGMHEISLLLKYLMRNPKPFSFLPMIALLSPILAQIKVPPSSINKQFIVVPLN